MTSAPNAPAVGTDRTDTGRRNPAGGRRRGLAGCDGADSPLLLTLACIAAAGHALSAALEALPAHAARLAVNVDRDALVIARKAAEHVTCAANELGTKAHADAALRIMRARAVSVPVVAALVDEQLACAVGQVVLLSNLLRSACYDLDCVPAHGSRPHPDAVARASVVVDEWTRNVLSESVGELTGSLHLSDDTLRAMTG